MHVVPVLSPATQESKQIQKIPLRILNLVLNDIFMLSDPS